MRKLLLYHNCLAVYLLLSYVKEYWNIGSLLSLYCEVQQSLSDELLLHTEHEMLFQYECT